MDTCNKVLSHRQIGWCLTALSTQTGYVMPG